MKLPDDIELIKKVKKQNGFTKKPDLLQILGFLMMIQHSVSFAAIIKGVVKENAQLILLVALYLMVFCLFLVMGWKLMLSDITTIYVKRSLYCRKTGEVYTNDDLAFYCDLCESPVGDKTKHCKICGRCVQAFDHHCRWANTCVGKDNYRLFMKLIYSALLYHIVTCGSYIYSYFELKKIREVEVFGKDYSNNKSGLYVWLGIEISICFLFSYLLIRLVMFHKWLERNKLTTYEYIVQKRDKKLNKIQPLQQKNKIVKSRLPEDTKAQKSNRMKVDHRTAKGDELIGGREIMRFRETNGMFNRNTGEEEKLHQSRNPKRLTPINLTSLIK